MARQKIKLKSALVMIILLTAVIVAPQSAMAAAGGIQSCTASTTCTIGEFLYDDSATPISGATCTITSKYPDHTSFLASVAMSGGASDGWYYHDFTAPATTGMYSTSVSCTVSGDTLSIDKSFEVNAGSASDPNAVAAAVWNYSSRSVTSFGSLIGDIWNNATRSLTESSSSTTNNTTNTTNVTNVTNTTDNAVVDTINKIKSTTDATRLLIEKVVNKPIIQNVLEDTGVPISEKLDTTHSQVSQLYINNQFVTAQSAKLAANWSSTSGREALDTILTITNIIGESGDGSAVNSMFGVSNWIKDSWSWSEAEAVNSQLSAIQNLTTEIKSGLVDYKKTPILLSQVKQLAKASLNLEKIIGESGDDVTKKTLYSKIAVTKVHAQSLISKGNEIDNVLASFNKSKDYNSVSALLKDLENQVIALNKVPGGSSAITKINLEDKNSVVNNILSLKGLIASNEKYLSMGKGQAMVNVWLEVGSIIFKTVATNPSSLVSQKVDIKYYLPEEIKKEDIIKTDAGLTVEYDSEKNQLYVAGTYTLNANQTRTFSVETRDIWLFSDEEMASLKRQAEDLYTPLQKTSFYAQAVSLKSDINANLERMASIQKGAVTPEDKIKAYREGVVLKTSIEEKLNGMKELVGQASNAGSLFGFVGGAQTIAVWGIIVIVIAGFTLMMMFMKSMMQKNKAESSVISSSPTQNNVLIPEVKQREHHQIRHHKLGLIGLMFASSLVSAGASGVIVNNIVSRTYQEKLNVLGAETMMKQKASEVQVGKEEKIIKDEPEQKVNLASTSAELLTGVDQFIVVGSTPTGLLNVRATPAGMNIVAQVKTGDKMHYIDENIKYFNVKLETGEVGWVSKEYTSKNSE